MRGGEGSVLAACELAMADVTSARWKIRDGDLVRAAELLERASLEIGKGIRAITETRERLAAAAAGRRR